MDTPPLLPLLPRALPRRASARLAAALPLAPLLALLAASPRAVAYGYDAYGRFSQVSNTQFQATYSYSPASHLLTGHTLTDPVSSFQFQVSRTYEPHRDLVTSVENTFGETVISRYDYANDALGRRASRADSGTAFSNPAFDRYGYNARSEVTGAQRYHGTNPADTSTVYGGREFGYAYDPIGNRTSATETIGGETLSKTYTANSLNQYTSIANPAFAGLRGEAVSNAVVTVNGDAVQSDAVPSGTIPWHFALAADNAAGPDFPLAEIVAVVNPPGTNTPDSVETQTGHLYAPPQAEALAYDDDGNLVSDGRWHYTWNGENRLVRAEELISPTNRQPYVVEYAYDHRGRMVWKTVALSNSPPSKTIQYIWDDYNIIAETVTQDNATNTTYNIWGLDLSGALQGAGGVGGLLALAKDSAIYVPTYDANGNITEYVSTNGTVASHYEYSPFGAIVVQSGDLADSFAHRFSTKPWCPVTGLNEYLYRKYNPALGRWMSRDPIGEVSFQHTSLTYLPLVGPHMRTESAVDSAYSFCLNSALTLKDLLGLKVQSRCARTLWVAKGGKWIELGPGQPLPGDVDAVLEGPDANGGCTSYKWNDCYDGEVVCSGNKGVGTIRVSLTFRSNNLLCCLLGEDYARDRQAREGGWRNPRGIALIDLPAFCKSFNGAAPPPRPGDDDPPTITQPFRPSIRPITFAF